MRLYYFPKMNDETLRKNASLGDLIDVQSSADERDIEINKVGIKDIKYPISIYGRDNTLQHTVADVNAYVSLPKEFKGTHMSRFIEVLNSFQDGINVKRMHDLLSKIQERLESSDAYVQMRFPFFMEKTAPVSGAQSRLEYTVSFNGSKVRDDYDLILGMEIPVTTLCPCSKAISEFGAHNQRSLVKLQVRICKRIWIEDLIELVEKSASCEIYPLLKREDEKYVTEKMYLNPLFVEDLVRNITAKLMKVEGILWFMVESENFESIHNHSAYACIEKDLRTP